ncbi:MAG TPA: hypothetical protein VIL71_03590, partial [Spirillospora sp.]
MTATGKPDDDHEVGRPEPGEPAPSSWLEDDQPSAIPLLPGDDTGQESDQDGSDYELVGGLGRDSEIDDPEDDPEVDSPGTSAAQTGAADDDPEDDAEDDSPEDDAPEPGAPGNPGLLERTLADQTITDLSLADSPRTMVLRPRGSSGKGDAQRDGTDDDTAQGDAAASQEAAPPAPPAPPLVTSTDLTVTDMPAGMQADASTPADLQPPPFPYAQQTPPGGAQVPPPPVNPHGQREATEPTREEYLPHRSPLHPPPEAGFRQEAPPSAPPTASPSPTGLPVQPVQPAQPAPPAQPTPGQSGQSAPPAQPPAAHPSQSPPAHEPFPYAQQIPGTPAAPQHEPFPFPQEIPNAQPAPAAPEPPPWAQQVPGASHAEQGHPAPAAPPPVIDEPWRTVPEGKKGKKKARRGAKKPLLIGLAGLAAAAVVAAGVIVVPGLLDDGEEETGARLAGSVFPLNTAVRTDGRDQKFTAAAASGSTVVAVGGESGSTRTRGLFVVSTDGGRTFASAQVRGGDEGSTATTPPQVVAGSSKKWIAIGSGDGGGTVWTSSDGRSWTRQPDAVGRVFGRGSRVTQVAATGEGFIAIGEKSEKGDFSDAEAAVWTSPDGRQWETRVGDQIGLEVTRASYSLAEVAASGDTVLLKALIKPNNRKPPEYRKVWRSQDGGRTWTVSEVPVPKGSRGLTIGGGEAGFVAVRETGKKSDPEGQAYVSKDGESWSKAGKLELDGYGFTMRILGGSRGFTALVRGGGDVLLAHSTDGRSWRPAGSAPGKPGRFIAGGALAEDRTTLVGHDPGGGDLDPLVAVWDANGRQVPVDPAKIAGVIRPDHAVQALAASGPTAVAVGSGSGDAAVWTSTDGGSWKAAQGLGAAFTRPGAQRLLDVAAGQRGWLAVGYDQVAPRRPLVVVSRDGATWQTADSAAAFGTEKGRNLATNAAASGSAGYVVVGSDGPSAAAWFSPD